MPTKWLSYYIFLEPPYEPCLTELVYPLTKKLQQMNQISQFFYIRYREGGHHIRLRCKPKREQNRYLTSQIIEDSIKQYQNQTRLVSSYRQQEYIPEVVRYGGLHAIELAHKQFYLSSHVILDYFLKQSPEPSYGNKLAFATLLHLISVLVFETVDHARFSEYLIACYTKTNDTTADKSMIVLAQNQAQQKLPFYHQIISTMFSTQQFESVLLRQWLDGSKQIHNSLIKRNLEKKLSFNHSHSLSNPVWLIQANYFHMTNNRLGIVNKDETFICYVIHYLLKLGHYEFKQ